MPQIAPNRWCSSNTKLVEILRDTFGKEQVSIRSPYHLQVEQNAQVHNIWIDARQVVKFRLADQAGGAEIAKSQRHLLKSINGHEKATSDLAEMRRALELSQLINAARATLPTCGLSRAVFVDAGFTNNQAQIGIVKVSIESDGEHVRAESHPVVADNSTEAEAAAIRFAIDWADADDVIFCDNKTAVDRAQREHGDRIRWVPRNQNKAADKVANLRKKKRPRKKPKAKRRKKPSGK